MAISGDDFLQKEFTRLEVIPSINIKGLTNLSQYFYINLMTQSNELLKANP